MGNQPSTPKITDQDRAIFQLKQQRDKIKQHQRKLTIICNKQTELAKRRYLMTNHNELNFIYGVKESRVYD